jgi:putative ABC transport system permease protein
MRSTTIVLRNLSMRKGRSIFNSIGLIIAIAVIVSTFTISRSMETQIGEEVEKFGPNIVVTPDSRSVSVPYGNVIVGSSTFEETHIKNLADIPNAKNIRIISPKLFGQAQINNENVLIVGLNAESERYLKVWWEIEGNIPQDDTNEALVGSEIKTQLGLDISSTTRINGESFTIVGVLSQTGSNDDYVIFLPLHSAQALLGQEGEISLIDIGALCIDCPVEVIAEQIMDAIPEVKASPVMQAVETRIKAVEQTANFSLLLATIVLIASSTSIMNTMISSVHQRKREIGVFMSLGADESYIYKVFLFEALILGISGGILGVGFGIASSLLLGPIALSIPIYFTDIPLFSLLLSIGVSIGVCILASLYPTWRATKIDPVNALKAI